MNVSSEGPTMVAPNLIGCGISEGSAGWNPEERGLFVPLDWVRSCEALIRHIQEQDGIFKDISTLSSKMNDPDLFSWKNPNDLPKPVWNDEKWGGRKWVLVSQGGLAPVAVQLAARNPNFIGKLVLASPPLWKEMTTSIPEQILARNYNFLRSPLGNLAFDILESRSAIALFSNLFLFANPCDNDWLDLAETEMGEKARSPVAVFNSGFALNQNVEEELLSLSQSTLVVQGEDDHRERREYVDRMRSCTIETAPGKNVIPWESPTEFFALILTSSAESYVP
jgi:pimeloyl-ACP methyl ester carboxylesterase